MRRPYNLQVAMQDVCNSTMIGGDATHDGSQPSDACNTRHDELLEAWDQILGSVYGSRLDRRLAWDGINSRKELIALLEEAENENRPSIYDEILENNLEVIKAINVDAHKQEELIRRYHQEEFGSIRDLPFIEIFLPILANELATLRKDESISAAGPIEKKSVIPDLIADLAKLLSLEATQVLYKEFNEQRTDKTLIEAHKTGRSFGGSFPREAYLDFCSQCQKQIHRLLATYPVMAWRLAICLEHWRLNTRRVIQRLASDWSEICREFKWPSTSSIIAIQFGEGDRHGRGQSVCILKVKTEETSQQQLIYKPRNMAIDLALNECIHEANKQMRQGRLRGVQTINKKSHGYCAFVEHKPCQNESELKEFYFNFGRLTALLHCLGATDCHHENIIASGTDPILVDAETLFEPQFETDLQNDTAYPSAKLREKVDSSVMRTMIIPRWFYMSKSYQANELTALGVFNANDQLVSIQSWLALNSDGMMPGKVKVPATVPNSLPVKLGVTNPTSKFSQDFLSGFELQLTDICHHKTMWLLEHGGLFSKFCGVPRRLVFRPTSIYGGLLSQARMQENSCSFLRCGLVYESMARAFIRKQNKPKNWELFLDECDQIFFGDIPFYWSHCDGKEIINYNNDVVAPDCIATSGLDDAESRLRNMEQADIDFQCEIINGAFVSRFGTGRNHLGALQERRKNNATISRQLERNLDDLADEHEAVRILRHLLLTSISGDESVTWLGAIVGPDLKGLSFGILDDTAAIGASGIGLYIAVCSKVYSSLSSDCQPLALAAMRNLLTFLDQSDSQDLRKWWIDRPAGLCGSGGTFQLFNSMEYLGLTPQGTRWTSFEEAKEDLLTYISPKDLFSQPFDDIYSGLSGLIGPIYSHGTSRAKDYALEIGHELVRRQGANGFWPNNNVSRSGFGHGNAGIAASLAFLYGKTKDASFKHACMKAVEAENHYKNTATLGWHDLRYPVEKNIYTTLWCQGSSGIGLSRLIFNYYGLGTPEVSEDLDLAVLSMLQSIDNGIDDLCCGSSGVACILEMIADAIESQIIDSKSNQSWQASDLRAKRTEILTEQVQSARERGHYRTMIANGNTELLSLMTGLAGIGISLVDAPWARNVRRSWLSCGLLPMEM